MITVGLSTFLRRRALGGVSAGASQASVEDVLGPPTDVGTQTTPGTLSAYAGRKLQITYFEGTVFLVGVYRLATWAGESETIGNLVIVHDLPVTIVGDFDKCIEWLHDEDLSIERDGDESGLIHITEGATAAFNYGELESIQTTEMPRSR